MAEKSDSTSKLLLGVIVAIITILAIVAIIIAAVSLGASTKPSVTNLQPDKQGGSSGDSSGGQTGSSGSSGGSGNTGNFVAPPRDKVWMIAVGHDWGAQAYIDSTGYIQGFQKDLIAEVCKAGGMQCRTVWEPFKNCWDSEAGQHSFGGKGLMGRWYDACTGWVQTVGRLQIFDFSLPFAKQSAAHWYKKKGGDFDNSDFTKYSKLGFIDGWSADEKCVARAMEGTKGIPLKPAQVIHYQTSNEVIKAILDGDISAAFIAYSVDNPPPSGLERVGDDLLCAIGGGSMMTRPDNEFNRYWNQGFQAIVSNGKFKEVCQRAHEEHKSDARDFGGCI